MGVRTVAHEGFGDGGPVGDLSALIVSLQTVCKEIPIAFQNAEKLSKVHIETLEERYLMWNIGDSAAKSGP
jgi:hypothetical protein